MGLTLGRCATRTHEDVTLHQQHAESNKGMKKQFKDKEVKIERERKRQTDRHSEKKREPFRYTETWLSEEMF